jgi:hypothetical protein
MHKNSDKKRGIFQKKISADGPPSVRLRIKVDFVECTKAPS